MGRQAGESRLYAGIHYQMDLDAGFDIARKVAARAIEVGVPKLIAQRTSHRGGSAKGDNRDLSDAAADAAPLSRDAP